MVRNDSDGIRTDGAPVFPGYTVIRAAGAGGSGSVFEGRAQDGARVAIKVLRAFADGAEALRNEYRILQSLDHPALARMHHFGVTDDGFPFIVMDWVDGAPLARSAFLDGNGAIDARRVAQVLLSILDALAYIHARRVVHGDIKPQNILVSEPAEPDTPPVVHLLDFGLSGARGGEGTTGLTGTLHYLAPELIRGEAPQPASDLYALGCVLYEALCGEAPFTGATPAELLRAHLVAEPAPVTAFVDLPAEIAEWVSTLLAKQPPFRYRSAGELRARVARFLGIDGGERAADEEPLHLKLLDIPREREMAKALELFARSASGVEALLIAGPTGVGTTRFLRDLRTELQIAGHGVSTASFADDGAVFSPVLRLLRTLPPGGGENAYAWEQVVAASFPGAFPAAVRADLPPLDADAGKLRLFHAAASLLLARRNWQALLVDDAHAADPMSREFLLYLLSSARANECTSFFLAIALDPDAGGPAGAALAEQLAGDERTVSLRFEPLAQAQLAANLRALLGTRVSDSFITVLHRQARGIPGLVEEMLDFCLASGILARGPEGWTVRERENLGAVFPASLEGLYERKLDGIGAEERAVLDALAIMPADTPPELLERLTELPALRLRELIARLSDSGLAESAGAQLRPLHPSLRAVLARTAAPSATPRNTALHDATLAWYAARNATAGQAAGQAAGQTAGQAASASPAASHAVPHAVLAHHSLGSSAPASALPHLLAAGHERKALFDFAGAEALFSKALPFTAGDPEQRFELLYELSGLCNILGKTSDEHDHFEEMLVLAGRSATPEQRLGTAYRQQADYFLATGAFDRARKSAEKALAYFARSGDERAEAASHHAIGHIEFRAKPGRQVLDHLERALEMYRRQGADDDEGAALVDIGLVHFRVLSDAPAALEHFGRARETFERTAQTRGLLRAFGNAGAVHYELGDYDTALVEHRLANELARRIGDLRMLATSVGAMSQCELALARYSDALAHMDEELRTAREIGDGWLEELCLENLAELYVTLGAWEAAGDCYTKAQTIALRSGNIAGQISCAIDLAGVAIERSDMDAALRLLQRARGMMDGVEHASIAIVLAYRSGIFHLRKSAHQDLDQALAQFRELGDMADRDGVRTYQVLARSYAAYCHLLRGRTHEALELSSRAMELLRSGGPLVGGSQDVLLHHALTLRANGQAGDAAAFIDEAYGEVMAAAATISDVQLYRSFLERVRVNSDVLREHTLLHRNDSTTALSAIREQNLRTLYAVSAKINSVLELPLLLDAIMDAALEAMNAERGLIFLLENEQLSLKVSRNVEKETIADASEISLSILRDVMRAGKPIIVSDTASDASFRNRDSVVNYHIHSLICVPMVSKDRLVGTVYVDSRTDAVRAMTFTDIDAEFLEAFANLASIAIENAQLHERLREENLYLRRTIQRRFGFENIIGDSDPMQHLFAETQAAITSDGTVLVYGESGTGKELIAKAIHYNGKRKDGHFVAIDCGALPDTLLESELFGYRRGAFTGAFADKLGLIQEAHNGTLFLDEISNTSLAFQAKLLRVLQEGEYRRVGDTVARTADVRIIGATNKNLHEEMEQGRFREDLFYRLNVIPIVVPPLRDRSADIPMLIQHFISRFNEKHGTTWQGATTECVETLRRQPWRGNVRELENLINRLLTQNRDEVLSSRHLPPEYSGPTPAANGETAVADLSVSFRQGSRLQTLVDMEREHIRFVMQTAKGNKTEAARILGLNRTTLVMKMKKLGLM